MDLTMSNNKLQERLDEILFENCIVDFKSKAIVNYMLENDLEIDTITQTVFDELLEDCNVKVCDVCKSLMIDGYCIDNGFEYRCSDECLCSKEGNLETDIPKNEWEELFADGEGDSYWTEWECEQDIYKKINEIVVKYPKLGYKLDAIYYPEMFMKH